MGGLSPETIACVMAAVDKFAMLLALLAPAPLISVGVPLAASGCCGVGPPFKKSYSCLAEYRVPLILVRIGSSTSAT